MKNRLISVVHCLLLVLPVAGVLLSAGIVAGQTDTTFTYQGLLTQNGSPVTTPCNLRFRLFDAASSGTQIGISQTIHNVPFSEGRFTVQIDFGLNAFDNSNRWLDILYQCPAGVGSFIILSPRQPVTRSPYAIQTRGIFVDADENVGLGTPVPADDLHIHRDHAGIRLQDDDDPLRSRS